MPDAACVVPHMDHNLSERSANYALVARPALTQHGENP